MDQIFSLTPPGSFNFDEPSSWPQWMRRFERFRVASGLAEKPSAYQVNSLLYIMGEKSDDILNTLPLSEEEKKSYEEVKKALSEHFIGRHNVIYERAKFNSRFQQPGESAESFITDVYKLAEHCRYGDLHEEMIRDRIVVGIRDAKLSERLQLDPNLTLDKTITQVRQNEEIKRQQPIIRREKSEVKEVNVDAVVTKRTSKAKMTLQKAEGTVQRTQSFYNATPKIKQMDSCKRCGKSPQHPWKLCPAREAECRKCRKKGHFATVCRSVQRLEAIVDSSYDESAFLGTIQTQKQENMWQQKILVNKEPITFKIDTGAAVTAIPASLYSAEKQGKLKDSKKKILGPNSTPLKVMGTFSACLQKDKKRIWQDIYVVTDLVMPLLGLPAIQSLQLLQQVANIHKPGEQYKAMFPKVFSGLGKLEGSYKIKLSEGAVPYALSAPRRVPLPLVEKVKLELHRMEEMGVIRRIEEPTPWCAGMVVVPKPNGNIRICVDLTRLNENVCRERHILPAVDETLAQLEGAAVFSKLDATSGFWQIPLHEDSEPLTTFITPFGRYCFRRLPFGISSAPEHFQLRISQIIAGTTGALCHADDVLVFGKDQKEHNERLCEVLKKFEEAGLTLNDKCVFAVDRVKFLGHTISAQGIEADEDKIKAILNMPEPENVEGVRRFMGMVNYVGKFSPHLPTLTKPLRDLLRNDNTWTWDAQQKEAFAKVKKELSSPAILAQYSPNSETIVSADASSYGLGGVLMQKQKNGEWRPVVYISRSLTPTETRYAQIEKEALATTWACERLSAYLLGLEFTVHTDHKPLISLLGNRPIDDLPPRILRFRLRLLRYKYNIMYVPGKQLVTADALSRAPSGPEKSTENETLEDECRVFVDLIVQQIPATKTKLKQIQEMQNEDLTCQQLRQYTQKGWPDHQKTVSEHLVPYWSHRADIHVANGILLKGERILIPKPMQREMLERLHQGHQGMTKCIARAQQSIWWPGVIRDVRELVERCDICCQHSQQKTEQLMPTPLPARPWQRVAADIFQWEGGHYLVVVDYFSRYIEVANLPKLITATTVERLKVIFARFGIPETLVTDNGPQFASCEFGEFSRDYDFKHVTSSPRYPQSNGEAERAVRTVKQMLRKNQDPQRALLAYRSTPLAHGISPAELLMGRRIRSTVPVPPKSLTPRWPDLKVFRRKDRMLKEKQQETFRSRHRAKNLPVIIPGQKVWIRTSKTTGTVRGEAATPRSYQVETEMGTLRRNRAHLTVLPEPTQQEVNVTVTRSGRISRPPERMDL